MWLSYSNKQAFKEFWTAKTEIQLWHKKNQLYSKVIFPGTEIASTNSTNKLKIIIAGIF